MLAFLLGFFMWAQVGAEGPVPAQESAPAGSSGSAAEAGAQEGAAEPVDPLDVERRREPQAAVPPGGSQGLPGEQPEVLDYNPFEGMRAWHVWARIFGEPGSTVLAWWDLPLTWVKVVALLSLLAWLGSWVLAALRDRSAGHEAVGKTRLTDVLAAAALIGQLALVFVQVAQANGRMPVWAVSGVPVATLLAFAFAGILLLWVEALMWGALSRRDRRGDRVVWVGMHVALLLGFAVALAFPTNLVRYLTGARPPLGSLVIGSRFGFTFMAYVAFARVVQLLAAEVLAIRPRRLYAIGLHSWIESFRKTRIPWAVLGIFVVILAFTHWFLVPPDDQRQAELSRLYVWTLMLLCSLLVTVMVSVLTPITLPNDIRFQTIYTVVTKPVRRLELIWGRLLGFMAVVTVLLLVLGAGSYAYLYRNVYSRVEQLEERARAAREAGRERQAEQLEGQLDQLRTRLSARVPVGGSLTFIDSLGQQGMKGIDVGQELEIRSHVEGATQAKAIWAFGPDLPHPADRLFPDPNRQPLPTVDRPVPLGLFLRRGTLEYVYNEYFELIDRKDQVEAEKARPGGLDAGRLSSINARVADLDRRIAEKRAEYEGLLARANGLLDQARQAEEAGRAEESTRLRAEARAMSSPDVDVQMTFTVYRTTKGRVGDPVYASMTVINPYMQEQVFGRYTDTYPIKEYYTNKATFPAAVLVGSRGYLAMEVQCLSPTQYLGMAEGDLFLVADQGSFAANYAKGLFGIWLQAMVLTAIGVWAGTFLSWPVALLTTFFFFSSGQVLFPVLRDLASNQMVGGGPFESLIRLVSHQNQLTEIDSTLGVVVARSFDSIAEPLMSRLIYVIPNLTALDVSNSVADGFAVGWGLIARNVLLALAYVLPFTVAGYFILKNREVAA